MSHSRGKKTAVPAKKEAPPTLRGLAVELHLSISTVSRALHDHPSIPFGRRVQIQKAARDLGYHPNPLATALAHYRHTSRVPSFHSEIVWVNCWPDPGELRHHKEFELYWQGASETAEMHGYRLEEMAWKETLNSSRLEGILSARNVQGILIPPHKSTYFPAAWENLAWEKFSVVRLGYSVPKPHCCVVAGNHFSSGLLAHDNMSRLGYTRLGFVFGHHPGGNQAGFLLQEYLAHKFGALIPLLRLPKEKSICDSLKSLKRWLKKYHPDAIYSDIAAMRSMLKEAGYAVPKDIGLATSSIRDGNADAGLEQNSKEIGKVAVETLIAMINRNQRGLLPVYHEILVESKWVDGSTLPHKGEAVV